MSDAGFDLDAYLARIGYDGPRTPTLEVLKSLHALHPAAIAFENIDVLLDRGVSLEIADIQAKLVAGGRGGYCFEHNSLLRAALRALGFAVEGWLARVAWGATPGEPPRPRTHMTLGVLIDGQPWLADVGFGGCVLSAPLRMQAGLVQPTPQEDFRLIESQRGELWLETRIADWSPLYRFWPEPAEDADFLMANWFTSTYPRSRFRNELIAARTTPQARYSLLQNRLTVRHADGTVERRELDEAGLEQSLARDFRLTPQPDWRPLIANAVAAGAA